MALHKPRRRQPPNPETMLIKCAACGYNPPTTTIRAANPISMVFDANQFKPPGTDNNKNRKPSLANMKPPSTSLHTILKRQPTHSQPQPLNPPQPRPRTKSTAPSPPMPKPRPMHNINRGLYCGCAPGGIRTPNLLIRSQMLYPLSYGRVAETRGFEPPVLR